MSRCAAVWRLHARPCQVFLAGRLRRCHVLDSIVAGHLCRGGVSVIRIIAFWGPPTLGNYQSFKP